MINLRLSSLWQDAIGLLYPTLCLQCRTPIKRGTRPELCLECFTELSYNTTWNQPENDVSDRFAGRLRITHAATLLHYKTGTATQELIHALKYYHRPEIGEQLGVELGQKLRMLPHLRNVAGLVPVPIHPGRRRQRGYNQAEEIAKGLSAVLDVPIYADALVRTQFKGSQTKLSHFERVQNVADSFGIGVGDFSGQHLLLVDDVVTTGATLDFCGNLLVEHHAGCRVGIAALAAAGLH